MNCVKFQFPSCACVFIFLICTLLHIAINSALMCEYYMDEDSVTRLLCV